MSWKDEIRKNIFEKDPEDMTSFMNVSPRMREAAKNRKKIADSKSHMIDQIQDLLREIEENLDETVTKSSMVECLEALTGIELIREEEEPKAKKTETYDFDPSLDSNNRGGDFDGQGTRV